MRYSYQAEKLSSARSSLMLQHTRGEAESIASAFHELSLAFHQLDVHALGDSAQRWVISSRDTWTQLDSQIPMVRGLGLSKHAHSALTTDLKYLIQ